MLLRICSGGIIFYNDKVFILKNEKNEWVLPKGKIRNGDLAIETAKLRVKEETGLSFKIISTAGETSYEFYSLSRQKPVCNEIIWFIMEADSEEYNINNNEFKDGGFFGIEEALDRITYSQDKSLVNLSYKKYLKLKKEDLAIV
ncbi:NUDIX hydrolase [Clostridium sp. D2Q-14]|uniref:NUDIX domain-containing protein n=1 Tax=Anaeromonas gelatinilytica TaxID=2683194 RepID=UPI00193C4234|nr:NUDIX hydrolase [Anaeromonas gelatinilytica]MBS4534260.1 NUDIX hydrolase [Anaeromonas gelatinilytica]